MESETINAIEITSSGQLLLLIESGGNPSYQYVYREAAGVYWDNDRKGFKSSEAPREWSYSDWFNHIIAVVKTGLGIEMKLSNDVTWLNIPEDVKNEILNNRID